MFTYKRNKVILKAKMDNEIGLPDKSPIFGAHRMGDINGRSDE